MKSIKRDTARHSVIKCLIHFNIYPERGKRQIGESFILSGAQIHNYNLQSMEMLSLVNNSVTGLRKLNQLEISSKLMQERCKVH